MRTMREGATALALVLAAVVPTWAADSATVYNSGVLVVAFVALCALVIIAQLGPVTMLLIGLVKGMARLMTRGRLAEEQETRR